MKQRNHLIAIALLAFTMFYACSPAKYYVFKTHSFAQPKTENRELITETVINDVDLETLPSEQQYIAQTSEIAEALPEELAERIKTLPLDDHKELKKELKSIKKEYYEELQTLKNTNLTADLSPSPVLESTNAGKTNTVALVSFILGILALVTVSGPLTLLFGLGALITGIFGLSEINKKGEKGKGFALTGLIIGGLIMLLVLLLVVLLASIDWS